MGFRVTAQKPRHRLYALPRTHQMFLQEHAIKVQRLPGAAFKALTLDHQTN